MPRLDAPKEVSAIREKIRQCLDQRDDQGRVVGAAPYGIYAFYDYDGEPIYVGQTSEKLRVRILRHLTNQRTDAVAMNVLDPFEVLYIEMWPFWQLEDVVTDKHEREAILNKAEYTVYQTVLKQSALKAVLNEKDIRPSELIEMPSPIRCQIVPEEFFHFRQHPDIRIARRANTIANLARVISEREVSPGLRRTLLTQARRLERLAQQRLADFGGDFPSEESGEETGES